MQEIVAIGLKESIYLGLSLFLIFWILRENKVREKEMREDINKREAEYKALLGENHKMIVVNQEIIKDLTDKLEVINNIQSDVKEIKININHHQK